MIQRKCGTCKYFEEGGIASSGWCKHPERQEIEHMVLVRKTELACRDGWDHDLWEPRDEKAQNGSPKRGPRPKASRAVTPSHQKAAADELAPGDGADILLDAGVDTISERRMARETDQASNEHNESRSDQESSFNTLDAWSSSFGSRRMNNAEAVDQLQDESISPRFGAQRGDWQGQLRNLSEQRSSETETIPAPPVFVPRSSEPISEASSAEWRGGVHENGATPVPGPDAEPEVERGEPQRVQQSGLTEQFEVDPSIAERQAGGFGVPDVDQESEVEEVEGGIESTDDEPLAPRQLPMLNGSKACCRNCRDFIPGKDGMRGWCNNAYAFEKRQEVNGDTVACQSSFGSWWSPSDDWWMERADIAHHSAPTPLVNHLIRQIRTRAIDEEGSTELRERS